MKKLLLCLFAVLLFFLLLFFISGKKSNNYKSLVIATTTKATKQVLATSIAAQKTYISKDGGYSVTYPAAWTPDLLPPLDSSETGTPIFSTGPIGNKSLGFPSFIKVTVIDNTEGLSLDEYLAKHFATSLTFKPLTISDKHGKEALDTQSTIPKVIAILGESDKIYEIIWYQGVAPKITQQQFTQFLADMKFT